MLANPLTADRGRPFNEGEVLGFPGAEYYVGDLSHVLRVTHPLQARHPLGRWSLHSLTRVNPIALSNKSHPVFDGIPCPLAGFGAEGILPTGAGTVEFHDFPAAAWWGPVAGDGAVQIGSPRFDPDAPSSAAAWAGTPCLAGGSLRLPGEYASYSGSFRRETDLGTSKEQDSWTVAMRTRYLSDAETRLFSGAMDLKSVTGGRWTALYGEYRKGIGNFNEWAFKTFLQRARSGRDETREAGGEARYLFNMAGFVESQWAAGGSRLGRSEEGGRFKETNHGFVQNTESFDALGLVMGDVAFRGDFERGTRPALSLAGGLQGHYGPVGLFASSEMSPRRAGMSPSRQHRGGLRLRPGDSLDAGFFLSVGSMQDLGPFHGPGVLLSWEHRDLDLFLLRQPVAALEAQDLDSAQAGRVREAGWSLGFLFLTGAKLEYRNRCRENNGPMHEGSLEQPFGSGWFLEVIAMKPPRLSGERESLSFSVRFDW